jgi:hypothetical protein
MRYTPNTSTASLTLTRMRISLRILWPIGVCLAPLALLLTGKVEEVCVRASRIVTCEESRRWGESLASSASAESICLSEYARNHDPFCSNSCLAKLLLVPPARITRCYAEVGCDEYQSTKNRAVIELVDRCSQHSQGEVDDAFTSVMRAEHVCE